MGMNIKTFKQYNESKKELLDFEELDFMEYHGSHLFAIALHRVTNFPIYVFRGYFKEYDGYEYDHFYTGVKLPNGNYLSSNGQLTFDELKKFYGGKQSPKMWSADNVEYYRMVEITELEAYNLYNGIDEQGEDYIPDYDKESVDEFIEDINNKLGFSVAKNIERSRIERKSTL
tara:strand:- start:33106 stop:33624 length:519 start_codon:yes stop_codon:yes gene_type:complete